MKPMVLTSTQKQVALKPFPPTSYRADLNRLTKQIEQRAYELFEGRGRDDGYDLQDWFKAEQEFLRPVAVRITEKENIIQVGAEVPGFKAEELEVAFEPQKLVIRGLHEQEIASTDENTHRFESTTRQSFRTVSLPAAVVPEKSIAVLKEGVLQITAEKADQPARITATAA